MEHKLHRTARETACEGAVLEFCRDTMVLPDGKEETWDYVRHKKGGGACAVPVLPDGRILLIRQFRPAIDRETLELPAGARDPEDPDPSVTAARELEEETGFRPGRMTKLARILTAVAWCNEATDIYLAEDLKRTMDPKRYVGRSPEQVTEYLENVVKPALSQYADELGDKAEINV